MAGSIVASTTKKSGGGLTRVDVALTCVAGAIAATSIGSFYGRLVGIQTDPTAGAGATMTATADLLITDGLTGAPIVSDLSFGTAESKRITQNVVGVDGVAITAHANHPNVNRDIYVAGPIKVAIANATTTDTGLVSLLIEEAA